MRYWAAGLSIALMLSSATCSDDEACEKPCTSATVVMTTYGDAAGFFDAPFPSDARRDDAGRPIVTGFPNPQGIALVDSVLAILAEDQDGFGVSSGAFFRTTAALDQASLPTLAGSVEPTSSVQLVGIDKAAPDYLKRYPVRVSFAVDPGPYGAPNLLSVVPLQGVPLRTKTRYAVVITKSVKDDAGAALGVSQATADIIAGKTPAGMTEAGARAHDVLSDLTEAGIAKDDIAALTVFTTGDPISVQAASLAQALEDGIPAAATPFTKTDDFPDFCVYASTIDMPVYQSGTPPYSSEGGGFVIDGDGRPILQRHERANFVVTVPKRDMPAAGYDLVVFSRTGGGGERPLVDRGVRATNGGEAIAPGTGPALEFARISYAGASIDGPHGGLRNITHDDEQLLVFNFQNPLALRDNIRQSALELALVPHILDGVEIDISDCDGAIAPLDLARFQARALMGHSMGASIAPLAMAFEPRYEALILSGAGGSFIENMLHKQKPLPVKALGELVLGLTVLGYQLDEGSPMLSMLQWAGEPADSPVYGRHLVREPLVGTPRHILMMQGIVDHYIMPPIANAASLSSASTSPAARSIRNPPSSPPSIPSPRSFPIPAARRFPSPRLPINRAPPPWSPKPPRMGSKTATRSCSKPKPPSTHTRAFWTACGAARRPFPRPECRARRVIERGRGRGRDARARARCAGAGAMRAPGRDARAWA
jgi:hypothetical protein